MQSPDLADWLIYQQATPPEAAELCATLADAMQHAHDHGVIQRDLKPSNIMLGADGGPHLMDFGWVKRESGGMTMTVDAKLLNSFGDFFVVSGNKMNWFRVDSLIDDSDFDDHVRSVVLLTRV